MTHPPAGPSTPPPPSGPRFGRLTEFLRQVAADRATRQSAAELAGARGQHATPLTVGKRAENYTKQSGRHTPRQQRRLTKKAAQSAHRAALI